MPSYSSIAPSLAIVKMMSFRILALNRPRNRQSSTNLYRPCQSSKDFRGDRGRRKGIHLPFPFENLNVLFTHPWMLLSQSGCDPIMEGPEEVLPPVTEGPGIVTSDVLDGVDDQASVTALIDSVHELPIRGEVSPWEDIFPNKATLY